MKFYGVDVTYRATIVERVSVRADNIEEAKQKIQDFDYDDAWEVDTEREEILDFDFFQEDELDENGDSIRRKRL